MYNEKYNGFIYGTHIIPISNMQILDVLLFSGIVFLTLAITYYFFWQSWKDDLYPICGAGCHCITSEYSDF